MLEPGYYLEDSEYINNGSVVNYWKVGCMVR